MEKITYEDLESNDNNKDNANIQLNLSKVERYLHGPMPDTLLDHINPNEGSSILRSVFQEAKQWNVGQIRHPSHNLVSPAAAVGALGELSPGGALMRGFQEQSLAQLVPVNIETEVRNLYLALCELLNHFWKCFPPTQLSQEEKAVKMHEALHRYHTAKLKPFEDKLIRELSPLSHHLTKHLNQLLNAAYQKFSNWQKLKQRYTSNLAMNWISGEVKPASDEIKILYWLKTDLKTVNSSEAYSRSKLNYREAELKYYEDLVVSFVNKHETVWNIVNQETNRKIKLVCT
ncbi:hypothetical protein HHI36_010323 [Cryptolaemus montrouzieri]|uniref:Uncharacterized protein n=1 Tax=Cryptolaemus montrouzieri TaxID=559131 RepID=A0ABD2MIE0_9CUCU